MKPFEVIQVNDGVLSTNPRPFSSATRANGFIFVSGQASVANGQIISDSFENQFHRSMNNLKLILEAAGASLSDVIRVGAYVHNPADGPTFNKLYREYFSEPFPARTTLLGCLNEKLAFEIDVVAVDPNWKPGK